MCCMRCHAMGSSHPNISFPAGGCFHRDLEHMNQTVHGHMSMAEETACGMQTTIDGERVGMKDTDIETLPLPAGWLSMIMQTINASYPHRDHILVNLGIPSHSFLMFAHHVCIEPSLPDSADLLILEHLPYLEPLSPGESAKSAEVLMHRLQVKFKLPSGSFIPTIILNMHRLIDGNDPGFEAVDKCVRNGALCSKPECRTQFEKLPSAGSENLQAEVDSDELAAHHEMVSLSYTKVQLGSFFFGSSCWRREMNPCSSLLTGATKHSRPREAGSLRPKL